MRHEEEIGPLLSGRGLSLATAESLTGGLVGNLVTSVSGASGYYRGGIISYATEAKEKVLHVRAATLAAHGPVSWQTAIEMAVGVRDIFAASIGISTTGVAGPTEQDGHPVGTLHIGIADRAGADHLTLRGPAGSRAEVRAWAAREALAFLVARLNR
ncbi:CinA family protein [Plantactinospora sp. B6F1]|uniref:CinA family protein n=1 Tax=Plantactinospora sp. B6F1 TaxID=3158971 RepID=UPI0010F04FF4